MILTPPSRGRKRRGLVPRLIEMQAYRCAVCGHPLELCAFADDPELSSAVKVDREQINSYENSVALCQRCASMQGNHASLLAYYEAYHQGIDATPKARQEYPETAVILRERLKAVGIADHGLARNFRYAPPDTVDRIFSTLLYKHNLRKTSNRVVSDKHPWGRSDKRRQLEVQNHRCAYCGERLITDNLYSSHYATWEHVVEKRNGGTHSKANLVMACRACNNLRDVKKMTAWDFYEWVIVHRRDLAIFRKKMNIKRFEKRARAERVIREIEEFKSIYSYQ